METESEKVIYPKKWQKCLQVFKKVMFSHIGTFLMVIVYVTLGGFLFKYLEENNEVMACKQKYNKYSSKLNESLQRIIAISMSYVKTGQIPRGLENSLSSFAKEVFKINYDPTKNCNTIGRPGNLAHWNLYNSIFFCVTIITTIGEHLTKTIL